MVSKLITPIVGLFFSVMTGYLIVLLAVYAANGGGAAGQAAAGAWTDLAIGGVTVLINGAVNMTQAIFRAAMGAIQ